LWKLVISKQPDEDIYSRGDLYNYAKILVETSALKQNNDPTERCQRQAEGGSGKMSCDIYGKTGVSPKAKEKLW